MTSFRTLRVSFGLTTLLGACAAPAASRQPRSDSRGLAPVALLATSNVDCEGLQDEELKRVLGPMHKALKSALNRVGVQLQDVVPPTADGLREAVRAAGPSPLLMIYAGHGDVEVRNDREVSVLCFGARDREHLVVDDLLEAIPANVPFGAFVLDACSSANIDVRKSRVPLTVISASSGIVKGTSMGTTQFGALLPAAIQDGDENCDGVTTDAEVVRYILFHRAEQQSATVLPKLRRQGWCDLPLFSGVARPACEDLGARARARLREANPSGPIVGRENAIRVGVVGDLARKPSVIVVAAAQHGIGLEDGGAALAARADEWGWLARSLLGTRLLRLQPAAGSFAMYDLRGGAFLVESPADRVALLVERARRGSLASVVDEGDGRTLISHAGWVGEDIETLDGGRFASRDLLPVPCRGPYGQCFAIVPSTSR